MNRTDDGFTLMEALVGLLILTIGLVALFSAFTGSVDALRRVKSRDRAIETARSLIEQVGITIPLKTGDRSEGLSPDGLRWRVSITRHVTNPALRQAPAVEAYWVSVTVEGRGAPVSLTTLRITQ